MFLAPSFNLKFFGKFQTERSVIKKFLIKRVYFVVLETNYFTNGYNGRFDTRLA